MDSINNLSMSYINDYFKRKYDDRRALWIEEDIAHFIIAKYCEDHKDDTSSLKCLATKKRIEDKFLKKYGWERTRVGFEHRSNFRIDEELNMVIFDTNMILWCSDGYISDGSEMADEFLKKHKKMLKSHYNACSSISSLYEQYEDQVKTYLFRVKRREMFFNSNCESRAEAQWRMQHTKSYFEYYGPLGKQLLIKWLNALNSTETTAELMLDEFCTDVDDAIIYFDENSSRKIPYLSFGLVLAYELESYSPKGRYFRHLYKDKLFKAEKANKPVVRAREKDNGN